MSNFLDEPADIEYEESKSIEGFLMQTIYPKLSQEQIAHYTTLLEETT